MSISCTRMLKRLSALSLMLYFLYPYSVTVVVAYLMKKHGMSLSQALELVKSKRPIACPNGGFIAQLEKFEKSLLGT